MELSQCINERRSIRDYQTKEVSRETILELINAAIKAPSWKNSQVSRYYVTDTSEKTKEFLPCMAEFNQKNIANEKIIERAGVMRVYWRNSCSNLWIESSLIK